MQEELEFNANQIFRNLIVDMDVFIDDYINADGAGHCLASYDHEEFEWNNLFYYRQ